ncbi:hypothetical protein SESBI_48643 [Sesbania bispinosa]|nr:hypothetical protein SESBI_48643 [Sesbania bispinosa]
MRNGNWHYTFAVTIWILWKARNELVFLNSIPTVEDIVFRVRHFTSDVFKISSPLMNFAVRRN